MGQMLEYQAQALGNVTGAYTTQAVQPTAVVLQGQPTIAVAATPADADSSQRIPTTAWVKKNGVTSGGSAPGSPVVGQLWYDTVNDVLKFWNGTEWETISSGSSAGDLTGIDAGPGIGVTDADTSTPKVSVDLQDASLEFTGAGDDGKLGVNLANTTIELDGANGLRLGTGASSGSLSTPVTALAAGAGGFDLAKGNFWTNALAAGTEIPAPTNAIAGTSGLIWTTTQVNTWNAAFDHPAGTVTDAAANSVIPFYVETGGATPKVLLGYPTEGIA